MGDGGVVGDEAAGVEVVETVVHEDHAVFAAGLHGGVEHVRVAFADEVADTAVGDEEFERENAAGTVGGGEEFLRDDALECVGELKNDLFLGIAFEDADDAFHGLGNVRGVKGGEDEVSGFSSGEGQ